MTLHYPLNLKMTSTQVVETSVSVVPNSPSQSGLAQPDDTTSLNYDMPHGFKPFTILLSQFFSYEVRKY